MTISAKRAEYIAWFSFFLSILSFIFIFIVGRYSGFIAIDNLAWFTLSSIMIWFVLAIQFHLRSLAEQEKLDMKRLQGGTDSTGLFEGKERQTAMFAVAQNRLRTLEKWFLPSFGMIIGVYQASIGALLIYRLMGERFVETKGALYCAGYMAIVAFITFLLSRYATGMSQQIKWKPLRAGGSILLAVSLLSLLLAIAMSFVQFKNYVISNLSAWIIAGLLCLLGAETLLNVVLDIYRPRIKGQYSRSSFDTRLLGLINEPGGIFKSLAHAIDYQFGFKVSETWFYKLIIGKALLPLCLLAVMVLYFMSCFVVINSDEDAIIEHFGNPKYNSGQVREIGPGLHLKWPWPIDKVKKYSTKRVIQLDIGYTPKVDEKTGKKIYEKSLLWGVKHYESEEDLLVSSEVSGGIEGQQAVPVSIVKVSLPVQYKVKDLYSFLYNYVDVKGLDKTTIYESEKLLKSICYEQLTHFGANAKVEVDNPEDLQESLLGAGRAKYRDILIKNIQQAANDAGLGVDIIFVGLQGIHPPTDLAKDYQQVIGAVQKKQSLILNADAYKNQVLGILAGSVEKANDLYSITQEYQQAEGLGNRQKIDELAKELDSAFSQAKGDIYASLRQAHGYAFEKATLAEATGERFASQLKAYNAAPDVYTTEQRLNALIEACSNIRKYMVVGDANDSQIFEVDIKEKLTPSLYDLSGLEETK